MNRLFIICILSILTAGASARGERVVKTLPPVLNDERPTTLAGSYPITVDGEQPFNYRHKAGRQSSNPVGISVTTSRAGELAMLLGEKANLIDTLNIEGPINDEDFNTIWQSSF